MPKTTQVNPGFRWCFTLNNYTEAEYQALLTYFKEDMMTKYIVGKEVGEQGTPHLQGYVKFGKRCRPITACRVALNEAGKNKIHWEAARGSEMENYTYCSKEGDFVTNMMKPLELKLIDNLYPWQKEVEDIVKAEPDDRTIHWIWDPEGNTGKSQLCKYLSAKWNSMLLNGKQNDILYMCAQHEAQAYLFDLTRAQQDYVQYHSMEILKNGCYMTGKYEGDKVLRHSPHIFVFANFPPKMSALSADRWSIAEIRNKALCWKWGPKAGGAAGPAVPPTQPHEIDYSPNSDELELMHRQEEEFFDQEDYI